LRDIEPMKQFFLLLYLHSWGPAFSQNYDNKAFSLAGNNYQNNNYSMDWSIGEQVAINSFYYQSKLLLTTGSLQGNPSLFINQELPDYFEIPFKIGANPILQTLLISLSKPEVTIRQIQIRSSSGILIYQKMGPIAGIHFQAQIDFQQQAAGIYLLFIECAIENSLTLQKQFKILKL